MLIWSIVLLINLITSCTAIRVIDLLEKLSYDDNLIDLNNGFVVQRIGTYSPVMTQNIIHTFISLDNFCAISTGDAICKYTSSSSTAKINIMELSNILKSDYDIATPSVYDKDIISDFVSKDLTTVISQYVPLRLLQNKSENVHFVFNKWHSSIDHRQASMKTPSIQYESIHNEILRFKPTAIDKILKQINNNRIGLEYLSVQELQFFLRIVFSNLDKSYKTNNHEAYLNIFSKLIIAQSVYAVRRCGISSHYSSNIASCIVVSTLFNQIPTNNRLVHSVYRLTPLPVIINDQKYILSNLPKIFGINREEQLYLTWDFDANKDKCTWSPIVSCEIKPKSTSTTTASCLGELLDSQQNTLNICDVSRSDTNDDGFMDLNDGLLFFYQSNNSHNCQIYSKSNEFIENFSFEGQNIVGITCNQTIICSTFRSQSNLCQKNTIIIRSNSINNYKHLAQYIIPSHNMTRTLLQTYHTRSQRTIKELMNELTTTQSSIKQTLYDFGFYISSGICSIVFMIFILIIKCVKKALQKEINDLDDQFQDYINPSHFIKPHDSV